MGKCLGAEQIVAKLRQIEILIGQGKSTALACKDAGGIGAELLPLA